ncbi:carboxypeptidase B-like [Neocloeon triangulifer]|uniref:carboxypeptidase B-like n=1 Tax=Neocloeon triangulifer TaxID=2078957 RepID=UPI00286EB93B|nr:carboxypeptidase B-like [Neocloeon triangulifer]
MLPRLLILTLAAALARAAPQNAGELRDIQDAQELYKGAQVLRVEAVSEHQKEVLRKMQEEQKLDTWLNPAAGRTHVDIMVPAPALDVVKDQLRNVSATFRVMISDVETAIKDENPSLSEEEEEELAGRQGHRFTLQSYHRVADIHGYLDYLAQTYPDICSVQTIGSSVEGRPIKMIKISSSKSRSERATKPAFYIDGGIHAREWISPASVGYIIKELTENRDSNTFADKVDFYIVPVVNPDGYEHTHNGVRLWRKNRKDASKGRCAGTDLNRNFGYKWGGAGSSHDPCQEIYAGSAPFSEPETQAIRNFVSNLGTSVRAYVTFHSYGQYILYPWGYDKKVPPDYADLDRVGKKAAQNMRQVGGASYTVGNSASLLYAASGGADDWAKGGPRVKYTYTIELRDRGRFGFLLPAQYIQPTGREAFAAIKTISEEITTSG